MFGGAFSFRRALVLFLALSLAASMLGALPSARGAEVSQFRLYISGEQPKFESGDPVMVAGVLHGLELTLDSGATNVTVVAHAPGTIPSPPESTSSYVWIYDDSTSPEWRDLYYGGYINASRCSVNGVVYTFGLGLDGNATAGTWNFTIIIDSQPQWWEDVVVKVPDSGFSISTADYYFYTTPFHGANITSYSTNAIYYTRVNNMGNVPLTLSLRFEPYGEHFSTRFKWDRNNASEPLKSGASYPVFHPGEARFYFVDFSAPQWSPREFEVEGTFRGQPQYLISKATVALIPAYELQFTINVRVNRSGYTLLDFGKIVVQYVKSTFLPFQNTTTLSAYFTGEGAATLALTSENVTITEVKLDGSVVSPTSIALALSNSTESHLEVTILADTFSRTDINAYLRYDLRSADGSVNEAFSTHIIAGKAPADYKEPSEVNWGAIIFVVALVVIVLAAAGYYVVKKGREKEERKARKRRGKDRS